MNTSSIVLIVVMAAVCMAPACSDSDTGETLVPIQWTAGALDPLGCPYVEPTPWISVEVHAETCGADCEPYEWDEMFVACISPDLPGFPPTEGGDAITCLTHPVTRGDYNFPTTGWIVLGELCWGECAPEEGLPSNAPEACYEDL